MKKTYLISLMLLVMTAVNGSPQNLDEEEIVTPTQTTADIPVKKNYWLSFTNMAVSNVTLWAVNRFVRKAEYAYISFDSIWQNLSSPWVWDQDEFAVNQLGHPYQGSFYYTGARSNGLNFWESSLVTITGSLMWEYFMETERQSINDLIVTTTGGIVLGEVLHRLHREALGLNGLLAVLISPMDAFNSLITGKEIPITRGHIRQLGIQFSAGSIFSVIDSKDEALDSIYDKFPITLGAGINISYFDKEGFVKKIPFSQFDFALALDFSLKYYAVALLTNGTLYNFATVYTKNGKLDTGFSLHYDMMMNNAINFSSNALGFSLRQSSEFNKNWRFDWFAHTNAVLLGASEYFYLHNDRFDITTPFENRTYDLGVGTSAKLGLTMSQPVFGALSLFLFYNGMWNIPPVFGGSPGFITIGTLTTQYEHDLVKKFSIGLNATMYYKYALYKNVPDVRHAAVATKLYGKKNF